jgi:hypothetical protein
MILFIFSFLFVKSALWRTNRQTDTLTHTHTLLHARTHTLSCTHTRAHTYKHTQHTLMWVLDAKGLNTALFLIQHHFRWKGLSVRHGGLSMLAFGIGYYFWYLSLLVDTCQYVLILVDTSWYFSTFVDICWYLSILVDTWW